MDQDQTAPNGPRLMCFEGESLISVFILFASMIKSSLKCVSKLNCFTTMTVLYSKLKQFGNISFD